MPFNFLRVKLPNNIDELISLAQEVKRAVARNEIGYDEVEPHLQRLFEEYCKTHTFSLQDAVQLLCTFMGVKRFAGKKDEQKLDLILSGKLDAKYRECLEKNIVFPVDIYLLHLVAARFQLTFYLAKPRVDPAMIRQRLETKLQQERDKLFHDKVNIELQLIQEAEQQQLRLELDEARGRAKREILDAQLRQRAAILQAEQSREQLALVDQQQMNKLYEQQAQLEQQEANLLFNREYMRQAQDQSLSVYRQQHPNVAERFAQQLEVFSSQIVATQQEMLRNQQQLFQVLQVGFSQISAEVQAAAEHILDRIDRAQQDIVRELKVSLLPEKIAKWRQNRLGKEDATRQLEGYLPLSIMPGFASADAYDLHQRMMMFLEGKKSALLLLGDCGTGKTLYALYLERYLWQKFEHYKMIPLFIPLSSCHLPSTTLVEDYLQKQGFNLAEITDLKRESQFVIIFDGYDEGETWDNLYQTNQLHQWCAKVIYTSRGDFNVMNHVDYRKLFSPEQSARASENLFEEWNIKPLSEQKIVAYIKYFLKMNPKRAFTVDSFMHCFDGYPDLKPLLQNPLSLQTILNVVDLHKFHLETFLDDYTGAWFRQHEAKLFVQGKSSRINVSMVDECHSFARKVALTLCENNLDEIVLPKITDRYFLSGQVNAEPSYWQPYFNANKMIGLIRTSCPLHQTGINRYVFLSSLLKNYFADRLLVNKPQPDAVDAATEALCQQGIKHELAKNLVSAFECYSQAAQRGHFRAQTNIALFYLRGLGGAPQDKKKAYNMLLHAARQGHQRAQFNLAKMCEHGDGISINIPQAKYWYNETAKQGDDVAKQALVRLEKPACLAAGCK